MTISMYQASIPVFIRSLTNLASILEKAAAHGELIKLEASVFMAARLAPDMHAFPRQIQIASDTAKGCAARLAGIEIPSFTDTENSFPELQERITKTIAFLKTVTAEHIDGSEDKPIILHIRRREVRLKALPYLLKFVLPNFFFHITTAYDILRHNGVEIGKADFIGGLD